MKSNSERRLTETRTRRTLAHHTNEYPRWPDDAEEARERPATGAAPAMTDPVSWLQIWARVERDHLGWRHRWHRSRRSKAISRATFSTAWRSASKQPTQIRYVPGEQVAAIYPGEVTLKIASADIGALEPFQAPPPETKWLPGKAASRDSDVELAAGKTLEARGGTYETLALDARRSFGLNGEHRRVWRAAARTARARRRPAAGSPS